MLPPDFCFERPATQARRAALATTPGALAAASLALATISLAPLPLAAQMRLGGRPR